MNPSGVYTINEAGHMVLGGHDARDLISEFGSPLVVILEEVFRDHCRRYKRGLSEYPRAHVIYAGKALLLKGICRILEEEGIGLDVVSWGELQTALAADFPRDQILMHGNAKTRQDLREAIAAGIERIVIDNLDEIERVAAIAEELERDKVKVLLRIAPGVKPSTHKAIQTGQLDSKFGFNLLGGDAEAAVRKALTFPRLHLAGLHCHIGSQIFDYEPFALAAKEMVTFYAFAQQELGAPLDELNLGGGIGIAYKHDGASVPIEEYLKMESKALLDACQEVGVTPPLLIKEPGRSIVGQAGVTLYTVQSIKKIEGVRNYLSVDGGMTDNPRYALYEAHHEVMAADRMNDPADAIWTVSGKCCESGDILQRGARLPEDMQIDGLVALLSTGAYTYSMASHYNRVAKPAVVLAHPDRVGLLARRETAEDLMRLDQMPSWLER